VADLNRSAQKEMEASPPRTYKELLARYAADERNFAGSDLDDDPEFDLSGVCLDGIDLSRSFLVASFRGASLRRASFHESNIKTCDFSGADLTDADFTGAGLCAAEFESARLDGARFEGAYIHSHTFKAGERPVRAEPDGQRTTRGL
jgi:uncharacterized protein YjbI with pentapeptide repeats